VEFLEDDWDQIADQFSAAVKEKLDSKNWLLVGQGDWAHEVFATGTPEQAVVSIELEHQLAPWDDPDAEFPPT
jgi:hypothetical protein